MQWFELVGLVGFVLSLGAYAAVQWQRDFAKTFAFSGINFVSSLLVGVTFFYQWNLASFVGNAVWGLISLYGLYRCAKYKLRDIENRGGGVGLNSPAFA